MHSSNLFDNCTVRKANVATNFKICLNNEENEGVDTVIKKSVKLRETTKGCT